MKILCIGRNYADHIQELANEKPDEPVVFLKPETALVVGNQSVPYPKFTQDMHHELEIVLRINKSGKDIVEKDAPNYFDAIGLGVDFTARDLQTKLKTKGLPWEISKAFDHSAPVSEFFPKSEFSDLANLNFHLDVNGEKRQTGNTSLMLFHFNEIISWISRYFSLQPGDLVFTGTPAGVSAVKPGDRLEAWLEDKKILDFLVS